MVIPGTEGWMPNVRAVRAKSLRRSCHCAAAGSFIRGCCPTEGLRESMPRISALPPPGIVPEEILGRSSASEKPSDPDS